MRRTVEPSAASRPTLAAHRLYHLAATFQPFVGEDVTTLGVLEAAAAVYGDDAAFHDDDAMAGVVVDVGAPPPPSGDARAPYRLKLDAIGAGGGYRLVGVTRRHEQLALPPRPWVHGATQARHDSAERTFVD